MTHSLREETRRRPPFSFEVGVYLNLLRTTDRLSAAENRLLRGFGLSHPQYNVLRILREAGLEGLSCGEIASQMITRVPDVTRLIDRLRKAGLVERWRCQNDRRVRRCVIRDEGIELLDCVDPRIEELIVGMLGPLGEQRLQLFRDLLREARADLEDPEAAERRA